ncbi:MAG: tetratricopeptide repeat protein [Prevotella sp.]|jgi:tetratricopeptide (TPR) repeat protein|nr:tetratricopeptide repeat protein [Prevotella sp.]
MKKIIFIIAAALLSIQLVSAQNIKKMFEEEQYQEIIDLYANNSGTLSSEDLMYIAQSYMNLGDIQNGLTYANMATSKGINNARTYFVTGVLYNANGDYNNAITSLEKSIGLAPNEANYYAALGDSYYGQENYEEALLYYKKATFLEPASEKAFFMIATIYATQGRENESLNAFYTAKAKITGDKELYVTVLYNIGKMEYDKGAYQKAINAYNDLISYFPDDYYSYEKLVQCYYGLNQIGKANLQKAKLYTAYKNGLLGSTSISDRFCFDQFKIGDKEIVAYERFEEFASKPVVKRIFYVVNSYGNISATILQKSISKNGYTFTMTKNGTEYTYADEVSGLNPKYTSLKAYVSDIVTGKSTAVSSK